jgi:signal transduction histidine kinase
MTLFLLTLVAVGVAQLMVARPLASLVALIDRVRGGDMSARLPADSADELGDTNRRFNAMVTDLAAARRRLDEAEADRERLMRTLEHADKLVTVGQLAAGVAHEIGTPLHVLAGRARSLDQRAEDPTEVRRLSKIVVEQVTRISRIVEQLLRSARRRPPDQRRIDVRVPVTAVLDLLSFEARRRSVQLSLDAQPQTPTLFADADQVQQIVLNLVRNAIAAVPEGGKVTVLIEPDALRAEGRIAEPCVTIRVKDTGEGMTDDVKKRVFDPFFTTRPDGTGLGLPVVRSLVIAHRGTIDVESAPGAGTEVIVRLPIDPTPATPAAEA